MAALADHHPASCRFCDPERLVLLRTPSVWRVLIPRALRPARLEARFEVNPEAPLLTLRGGD
jgi:hypothetical protein